MAELSPDRIMNFIDGAEAPPGKDGWFEKRSPADGALLARVARSAGADVDRAIVSAKRAQAAWDDLTPVARGDLLRRMALKMSESQDELARSLAVETGRSLKDARGEIQASIEAGFFFAGEGRRSYGRTTTSAVRDRTAAITRQSVGVAGLIIAANTPVANFAWKVFPALVCGNTAVLKPSEDAPITASTCARMFSELGLPRGVLNVVNGYGEEAGAPLVESPDVDLLSFTGSVEVGRFIQRVGGARLAKVCMELGGKNPLIVCEDADLEHAVSVALASAFGMAGQRCSSASRIVVHAAIYEVFRERFVAGARKLRVGVAEGDDLGPVINEAQLKGMEAAVSAAEKDGARVLLGGKRLVEPPYDKGTFLPPTIVEGAAPDSAFSRTELFGPITSLYRVDSSEQALRLANESPLRLTAAVHTKSVDRALWFVKRLRSGVVNVNGATFGSEPHMPFGGLGNSGTGWREAGTEALDFYSDWKTVYMHFDPGKV
jgi:aldehyde dehydrogenase (NAD+)